MGKKKVEWKGNRKDTRLQVPLKDRIFGMTLKYFDGFSYVEEQFCYNGVGYYESRTTLYKSTSLNDDFGNQITSGK